jgi:putative restriction endonuclease
VNEAANLYIYPTDTGWYQYLSQKTDLADVNFWQPSPVGFKALQPGELFLFRVKVKKVNKVNKAEERAIGGGGFFVNYQRLSLCRAWDMFGCANGVDSFDHLMARIGQYRKGASVHPGLQIGCILLTECFFWPEEDWISLPPSYPKSDQKGKHYAVDEGEGRDLYTAVMERL